MATPPPPSTRRTNNPAVLTAQVGNSRSQWLSQPQRSTSGETRQETPIPAKYRLYTEDGKSPFDLNLLGSSDPRHLAATAAIRLALALFHPKRGSDWLVRVAQDATTNRKAAKNVNQANLEKMEMQVHMFVVRAKMEFVNVTLTKRKMSDASFCCLTGKAAQQSVGSDSWNTENMGTMFLNQSAIEAMVEANKTRQTTKYNRLVFNMGAAIARELVPCFLSTLRNINMAYLVEGGAERDLICRRWQYGAMGGLVMNRERPKDTLGVYQAGTLWLLTGYQDARARQIDDSSIEDMVEASRLDDLKWSTRLSLTLDTVGETLSEAQLDARYRTIEKVRADRQAGAVKKFLPGNGSLVESPVSASPRATTSRSLPCPSSRVAVESTRRAISLEGNLASYTSRNIVSSPIQMTSNPAPVRATRKPAANQAAGGKMAIRPKLRVAIPQQ